MPRKELLGDGVPTNCQLNFSEISLPRPAATVLAFPIG